MIMGRPAAHNATIMRERMPSRKVPTKSVLKPALLMWATLAMAEKESVMAVHTVT
jgi:hypothetical protein